MVMNYLNENFFRGDGTIPTLSIEAENLAEATHKAIIACHDYGARVETPKHHPGGSLGYDAIMEITVKKPDSEPKIYFPGIQDDARGLMQYMLEVTHGIHNHWKKDAEHPDRWGYTYNERFDEQIPGILARIQYDWNEKKRITGRDYNFGIWRPDEDVTLAQEDPPCWQRGNFRFLQNNNEEVVMNYFTDWRSRDLFKAWNENNLGQIELMKAFAMKVSDMLDVPIKLGSYIDHASSLHLYGFYIDRDGLEQQIEQMKEDGWESKSMGLEDYLGDRTELKRLVGAQVQAEEDGHGLNQPKNRLEEFGYDVDNFEYPAEWDTWPDSWDVEI
jgi:thymidylate synthase